jgi:acyl dehydratase
MTDSEPDAPLVATTTVRPNEVDLFMFSAATWLTHRIHFDREYARTEGFPDLVVHGPLQGAYLSELLTGVARIHRGQLRRLYYRHHRSAFCNDQLTLLATVAAVAPAPTGGVDLESELRILLPGGEVATTGSAVLWLPDRTAVDGIMAAAAESAP